MGPSPVTSYWTMNSYRICRKTNRDLQRFVARELKLLDCGQVRCFLLTYFLQFHVYDSVSATSIEQPMSEYDVLQSNFPIISYFGGQFEYYRSQLNEHSCCTRNATCLCMCVCVCVCIGRHKTRHNVVGRWLRRTPHNQNIHQVCKQAKMLTALFG